MINLESWGVKDEKTSMQVVDSKNTKRSAATAAVLVIALRREC